MSELITPLLPYLLPIATLVVGFLAEKGLRKANVIKGEAEAKKVESEAYKVNTEAESNKITDMEKSLKFWVAASDEMNKKLTAVQDKMEKMEIKFTQKVDDLVHEKEGIIEEKEALKVLILELRFERDEFKILNEQLRETIERQDAKIVELEKFIQKQNMKISTLESKLQKYSENND